MNVIEMDNISFSYNQVNVLEKINLTVTQGDYIGIIGSNGAGKSTLLKLILGLLKPSSGNIKLFGKKECTAKDLQKIGYIPQNSTALFGEFPATVEEIVKANLYSQIGFLRFQTKKQAEMVRLALKTVGMQDYEKRMIGELSGGQQQRVMIAHVLISNPQILLLDEPTAGIDRIAANDLYILLKQLNEDFNITILMVTHDIARASHSAKHLLRLNRDGFQEELYDL